MTSPRTESGAAVDLANRRVEPRAWHHLVMRFRLALTAAIALAVPFGSTSAQATERVGCNALAITLTDVDGFTTADGTDLGIPTPTASDASVTRAFENDGLDLLLLVSVAEYDTATEAAVRLGDFSEGFLESATSSIGPITRAPGSVTYSGVSPGTSIEALESTVGRYVVASLVLLRGGPTADESESVLNNAVELQSTRIPDRCLSDVVDEPIGPSSSSARRLGQLTGLIVIGGATIWGAWVLTTRARRSDPAEKWAP